MKKKLIKIYIIWRDARAAYQKRYLKHQLGS